MKKHTIAWTVALVMGIAAMAHAAQFTMDLYLDAGTGKTLTFGMAAESSVEGLPPQGPGEMNFPWLEGPGDVTQTVDDDDFGKLSVYIKAEADAALWKLYVNRDMKITFKLFNGALPAGSVLRIYPEGAEGEAVALTDGTTYNGKENTTYLIDYRETSSTEIALLCPALKRFQMSRNTTVLALDLIDSSDYGLGGDTNVKAYSGEVMESVNGSYTQYTELDGNYGTFDAATSTLTMTNMTNVARVQFNYWYTAGARSSEKAVVIVDVTDGLMTALVKKEDAATGKTYAGSVIAVDPDEDGYDGTVLTYKIDFDAATVGNSLTLKVNTPKYLPTSDAYGVKYSFTDSVDGAGEFVDLPEGGAVYAVTAQSIYLKVKATLTSKCESGAVTPTLVLGDGKEIDMESVQMALVTGGTMDIDGDGEITVEDAIMYYNFVTSLGFEFPEFIDVEIITDGIVVDAEQAEHALAVLKSAPAFLDYDGDGEKTVEDAVMMYNFITSLGVEFPDFVDVEIITDGIVVEEQFAETALANFKKYSQK